MISGIIEDFVTELLNNDTQKVRFLVREFTDMNSNTCQVVAEVPAADMDKIKNGLIIWWHNPNVYIAAKEDELVYTKVGFSSGDRSSFYSRTQTKTNNK